MIKAIAIKLIAVLGAVACALLLPWPLGLAGAAIVVLLALGLIAWAVFDINSSFWAPTLWRSPTAVKAVALTFDDGPDPEFTPQVLEVLRAKGVTATFFCVGARVRAHPGLAKAIREQGHALGNHSDSHAMTINFSLHARLRREIRACNDAIETATGVRPTLYRAPHGFKNPALGDVLRAEGMTAIGWQVRGFDAVVNDAAKITQRIVEKAQPGGVILLHDGAGLQGSTDRTATLEALPVVIDGLRAKGLEIVPLEKLLGRSA
ncbi:MAG: polysaccharide deacetylase family protein [Planctomycetes bacterium]|nr:polysaccharide deacetylase family protein [Planctomycetota bacterium]MCW8136274.1 polysaccharide deacetylase family protein [Planctomycetota bacterium]